MASLRNYRLTVDWKTVDGETADGKSALSNTIDNKTYEPTARVSRFDEFWEAYPNKVGKRVCQHKWKTLRLDTVAADVMAGLARWKASDRWARGYIKDPLTFLNQEIWREAPPLEINSLGKGEIRVRDTTPAEAAEAAATATMLKLLRQHPGKSEAEIVEMMNQNRRAA